MLNKKHISANFSRAALQYDAHALLQKQVANDLFRHASALFPKIGKILDAGCGTGIFQQLADNHHKKWNIIQYDLAEGMCRLAHAKESNKAATVNGDIEHLPFADESLSGVHSSLTLQWVANPVTPLKEMVRVLKPNKYCVISTFGSDTLKELRQCFIEMDKEPHVIDFADSDMLKQKMQDAGFSDVHMYREPYILHYSDSLALIRGVKAIGASYNSRTPHYLGKAFFAKLEALYQQSFGTDNHEIPATWDVITIIGKK